MSWLDEAAAWTARVADADTWAALDDWATSLARQAATALRDLPAIVDALVMNAERFTCDEAEAVAAVLALAGTGPARHFMVAHAAGDDLAEGDRHETIDDEPGWRVVPTEGNQA